ncbi:ABC transporter permease [Leifsonia shinshuensis]|uniref:ABC-2 type transport system permease protein n=1 Tax=Leifsonia shinshuensis TaxID=150026 RepID=A0A853CSL9_9MICO|nr:ABC transporter permease [Leifsonia shinshuensis]NYJ22903.1 ABC-2 type transport system permease protein [Leifsonia shinshuensis]
MNASATAASLGRPASPATGSAPRADLHGLPHMLRFVVARNWLRLLVWAVVLVGMIPLVYESQRAAFPTQASREAYARIADTPSVAALTGTPYAANTLGGILVLKIWMTLALSLALATIFLVTRNGRADEEGGRAELLRANSLGLHAYTVANYLVVGAFDLVVGAAIALTAAALTLPVGGSLVLGGSLAAVGLFFLGVSALFGQLASTGRGANGWSTAVLGAVFVLRAVGDLNGTGTAPSWVSWLSPIGWGQAMRPYGENRWWPALLLVGGAALLCAIALRLEGRRDLGAGVLADRAGAPRAGGFLTSPFGLAVREQRGLLVGWFAGSITLAILYGSVATAIANLLGSNPVFAAYIGGHTSTFVNAILGWLVLLNGIIASAFGVQTALQARSEEAAGYAEPQLAGSISRLRWSGSRLLVAALGSALLLAVSGFVMGAAYGASTSDFSPAWTLTGASLAYWPAVLVSAGVPVLLFGLVPRLAGVLSWSYLSAMAILSFAGTLFGLPSWLVDHTPLTATPRLPGVAFDGVPLAILAGVAVVLWTVGLVAFRRRDLAVDA